MIWGVVEHDGGKLNAVSAEMLTLGRGLAESLAMPLAAVLIGNGSRRTAEGLGAYGVTHVYLAEHERLDKYAPEAWAQSLVQLANRHKPQAILAPGSDWGNEVLAHVAALLGLPMAAHCTEINPDGEHYVVTRLRWGGSLLEEARLSGNPKLLTVAPHVVAATAVPTPVETSETVIETFTPSLDEKAFRVRLTGRVEKAGDHISLADARVVVGGGRGVGSAEGFAVLEELADLLGGAVGGSRVVTNLGWRPHADQVGQTGTRIAPDLYIACGISGAIQHMVGCAGAKHLLAINTDRQAPMMAKADYAVIGDLHEILPALIEAVKKAKRE
jgi:electron transfer flavoprotein alpha subunit